MSIRNSFSSVRKLSFLGVLIFALSSCYNDPEFIGNNLIPNDDIYAVKTDTLFELSAYTLQNDSLNTYLASNGVLGFVNSEIFGSTKASFVARYLTSTTTSGWGGATAKPDSLIFYFTPSGYCGDSTVPITINIHEITDTSVFWEPYNGLKTIEGKYNPMPLVSKSYSGIAPLKISIDTSFARQLMDSSLIANPIDFFKKFKGLYITCNELSGYGGVAYSLNTSNAFFRLFYHYNKIIDGKDSTIIASRMFNFTSARFFQYLHDYTKANPAKKINFLNDTINQDSVFYVQGLGGVYGKICLDGISQWKDSMPIIINRAELIIGKDSPLTLTPDSIINQLVFYYKIDSSWAGLIIDQNLNNTNNGKLRLYSQDYNVNITSQLQRILEGEIKDKSIYVFSGNNNQISRVVLQSGNHSRKLKLKLTYTKLR